MGLRLILTALTIWLVFHLARRYFRQRQLRSNRRARGKFQATVQCAHCGTHLPANEALQERGRHYCCKAHLEADRSRSDPEQ